MEGVAVESGLRHPHDLHLRAWRGRGRESKVCPMGTAHVCWKGLCDCARIHAAAPVRLWQRVRKPTCCLGSRTSSICDTSKLRPRSLSEATTACAWRGARVQGRACAGWPPGGGDVVVKVKVVLAVGAWNAPRRIVPT